MKHTKGLQVESCLFARRNKRWASARFALWKHMYDTHNVILLESEMDDIERLCDAIPKQKWRKP